MATEFYATPQTTGEIRTHFIEFDKDLPSGVTVSSATGTTTTYPVGGTATITIGVISSDVVPVTVASPTVAGVYYVDVVATLSSGDKSVARLIVPVSWASLRAGMTDMVQQLRELTDVGVNDYKVGGVPYWSDKHLQDYLDRFRVDFIEEPLYAVQQQRNGTTYYLDYRSQYANLEGTASGTAIFKLDNSGGTNIPGTMFTVDTQRGVITFVNDTAGSSMMLTGRAYDLNAAAADVWRSKAANAAKMYTFAAGGQSFQRKQYFDHCIYMAQYYEGQSAPTSVSLYRGDNIAGGEM